MDMPAFSRSCRRGLNATLLMTVALFGLVRVASASARSPVQDSDFAWTIHFTGQNERPSLQTSLTVAEKSEIRKGKVVVREIPNPGKPGKTFEAIGVVPGALEDAFAVITNFRRYAEFMPHVKLSVVCDESQAGCVVEILLGLPLGQSRRYRLMFESVKLEDAFEVRWRKVPWPELPPGRTIKDTSGRWLVEEFEGVGLLASYLVYTDPRPVPLGLTGLANAFGKSGTRNVIEKLKLRLRTPGPAGGEKRLIQSSAP